MTPWQIEQMVKMARRVLAEADPDPRRKQWAEDVVRYVDARDEAAGKRIGVGVAPAQWVAA